MAQSPKGGPSSQDIDPKKRGELARRKKGVSANPSRVLVKGTRRSTKIDGSSVITAVGTEELS